MWRANTIICDKRCERTRTIWRERFEREDQQEEESPEICEYVSAGKHIEEMCGNVTIVIDANVVKM